VHFLIFRVTVARNLVNPDCVSRTADDQVGDHQMETAMNWDRVEGNWKQIKGKVHQQWGKLTNDDLEVIMGKRTELAGRLQQRYGIAKDDAERQIDDWLKTVH
jgi:uncharacterized protein YjbJ (UPF0337 family)